MNLTREMIKDLENSNHSLSERAELRCRLARELEEAGNYDAAREVMGEFWNSVGERPNISGLSEEEKAEVLQRAGSLTGWIGSAHQIEGAQEMAKNLISEAIRMFEVLHSRNKVAEANTNLAVCYWREGSFDEARVLIRESLARFNEAGSEMKAVALLRGAMVERAAKRFNDALSIYVQATPLFTDNTNCLLRAQFHHGLANVLNHLGVLENRPDYTDRALIEYTAASFHFELEGHARYQACVENNLGFLLGTIARFQEAHDHLDRAQTLFTTIKDSVHLAQVDETRARVMLAEGRVVEAEKTARRAVRTLDQGDEQSLLAEALTTQGLALARLNHPEQSQTVLERAVEVASRAGDPEGAGNAAMVLIEELGAFLPNDELKALVDRARELLVDTQDLSTLKRLATCAGRVLSLVHASPRFPANIDWNTFSFKQAILDYEAHFIGLALDDTGGVVSRAARLLGFNHHQSLLALLNGRHEILRHRSNPIVPRRRSIIRTTNANGSNFTKKRAKKFRILHVEDNEVVAQLVQERLSLAGFEVDMCADGREALEKIAGNNHYNLLLLDNELPGVSGLELTQHARGLAHHHQTPIVILSATLDDQTVRTAGANAFLRKPEDIAVVGETITRLLQSSS